MDQQSPPDISAVQFPSMGRGIYADHAAISPWPRVTMRAVRQFAEENCLEGARAYTTWLARETRLRERVAGLLNAPSRDDIAFTQNTTEGVCIVAGGIDWQAGDNLVTPKDEFPTNQLAWEALRDRGVEIRRVDIRNTDDAENALLGRMDHRTRVLTVSSVQWQDGFRLQLDKLGQACRNSNALLFVDAIQEFGALQIDVQRYGVDCLASGAHKWLMGPEGIGIFYCSPATRARLRLARHGWHMLEKPHRYDLDDRQPSASAGRFEPGSPNMLGQAALEASLGLLNAVGLAEVERRILFNSRQLMAGLGAIPGLRVTSAPEPERISGIVSFAHREFAPRDLLGRLRQAGVTAAWRGKSIRLSPHFYQYNQQIDALLEAVETSVNK
jgi:selenocysteine lyase/cysteine desulfurase